MRLSVGSVTYDRQLDLLRSLERKLGAAHIMASGSLPPGFPPVLIDGDRYWDGGMVSNSPLWYLLDDSPDVNALIVQVDLFSARGELPANLDQVLERKKDIRFSGKTRFNTKRVQEVESLRLALGRLMRKMPAELHEDPDTSCCGPRSRSNAISRLLTSSTGVCRIPRTRRITNSPARRCDSCGKRASKTCGAPAPIPSGSRRRKCCPACGFTT